MPEAVVRWKLKDMRTNEVQTLELNPNQADSYLPTKEISWSKWDNRMAGFGARTGATPWTFGGVVQSKSHHDELVDWAGRPGKVRVTDHLGRVFEVMIEGVDMIDRRPTANKAWRFTYTFKTQLLRRIA